jgi:hypothetical protein
MLLLECINMGMKTEGTLKPDYLLSLPFNEYEFIRKKVNEMKG